MFLVGGLQLVSDHVTVSDEVLLPLSTAVAAYSNSLVGSSPHSHAATVEESVKSEDRDE